MAFPLSSWRLGALAGLMALLSIGTACHKSDGGGATAAGTTTIKGTVTYTRIPLIKVTDTASPDFGKPLGLEGDTTKFKTDQAARGVTVRAFQRLDVESYDESTTPAWVLQDTTNTDEDGAYTLTVTEGYQTFIELISNATYFDSDSAVTGRINVLAEPGGMASTTFEPNRLFYALRKAPDGTAQTNPAAFPSSLPAGKAVDFKVGLNDPWCITPQRNSWNDLILSQSAVAMEGPDYAANPSNPGTGSRVLAILDSGYSFGSVIGNPSASGTALDLHYFYDRSGAEAKASYIDYDIGNYPTLYPQAFDGSYFHYFGFLQGGTKGDDAFDEGVLFSMFAKNLMVYNAGLPYSPLRTHAPGDPEYLQDLQDLSPDLAVVEGLAPALAASLLKSPYIAHTTGQPGGGLSPLNPMRDIRDTTGLKRNVFSAPALTSLGWEIILKANSLATPGTADKWDTIVPKATRRFFITSSSGDIPNAFHQIFRLQESQSSTEPVNLAAIFTDTELASMLTPYNIPWPRPTSTTAPNSPYLNFTPFWSQDPNSQIKPLPSLVLSMANAHRDGTGRFPNLSWGVDDAMNPTLARAEIFTAFIAVSKDTTYDLSLNTSPAIPASATVEVFFSLPSFTATPAFRVGDTYTFGASSNTQHYKVPIGASGVSTSSYAFVPIRVRLISPEVQQPSDLTVTLNLVPLR